MFRIITLQDENEWDATIRDFHSYDVYYLSAYVKPLEKHGDGTPILIYYKDAHIQAINVVMRRDIADHSIFKNILGKNQFYDLSTPYGYGGFIIEGIVNEPTLEDLNNAYTKFCYNNNIISEFVRFHPVINNVIYGQGIYETKKLGPTITLNLNSREQVWSDLSSKNRNVIRKALKFNIEIKKGNDKYLIDTFYDLYNETMQRDNADPYYYFDREYYVSMINEFRDNCSFFYAVYDDRIVSMAMILHANNYMHYHLSASNREYQSLAPTNLLLYTAACWGADTGLHTFHLGGGLGSKPDSLFKFKQAFNKKSETNFCIGKKIFNNKMYEYLVQKRNLQDIIADKEYFPLYRS